MEFIPAKESKWFIGLFRWYTRWLFRRRFSAVWLRQEYDPCTSCRTVYYLNHNSWWDGLIPLLLNEFVLKQRARALMEDKQMVRYPFFRRIGAFSINREDPRKAVTSLRYAVQSMNRRQASLFIYPEGTITADGTEPEFEGGLAWLHGKLTDVDFVPIAVRIQTMRTDKPELHLHIGRPVVLPKDSANEERTRTLERELSLLLEPLRARAGMRDEQKAGFERLI